nr:immunoglobulin light chain junction region [Macaca mulatta]
CQQYNSNQLTF